MQDLLKDIVGHTQNLGFLNIVKITGTDKSTLIDSMADDRSVIMHAETTQPCADMVGTFGMPQLNKLKFLLECSEYKEGADIKVVIADRNGETIPVGLHFENSTGDFKNDYRFMNTEVINEKLKTVKFKGVPWHVEVSPTLQSIQRFALQAAANNEHTTFLAKTENGNLKFIFGDQATHGGEFIFATNVTGTLNKAWTWPISSVLAILKIADVGNATVSFSNDGAMQVTIDTGIATYKYIIPAQA
jgi:hypothetical protein